MDRIKAYQQIVEQVLTQYLELHSQLFALSLFLGRRLPQPYGRVI